MGFVKFANYVFSNNNNNMIGLIIKRKRKRKLSIDICIYKSNRTWIKMVNSVWSQNHPI